MTEPIRASQNKPEEVKRKHNVRQGESQARLEPPDFRDQASDPWMGASFSPQLEEDVEFLEAAPSASSVTHFILHSQQTRGNRYVQHLIQTVLDKNRIGEMSSGPVVQRSPTDPSTEVPALTNATVQAVNAALQRGTAESRQQAVNIMTNALINAGVIDAQRLENRRILYQPGFAPPGQGYGLTSLTPGTARPRPCQVKIGDPAVASASILYSTIMHEYQHVNQYWENTEAAEEIDEIRAYLYEIENLPSSGLSRNYSHLSFLRRQLMAYWDRASPEARAPFQQRYDQALQTIEDCIRAIQTGR